MSRIEETTMCMLLDGSKVLMINREKRWPGWAFPGGHREKNETLIQCVKREMLEETGLDIDKLEFKGIVNIYNTKTKKRLLVNNYISRHYSGTVKNKCDEGKIEWVEISDIDNLCIAEGLEYRLPLFFDEGIKDLYIEWDSDSHYTKVEYKTMR